MSKPEDAAIDLAHEREFELGGLRVLPSSREVFSGHDRKTVEPRVLQALMCLARAQGTVVSRDELIRCCWGGRIVGEDAINRCIAKARRLAEDGQHFTIETIARVGYRLTPTDAGGLAHAAPTTALPLPDRPSIAVLPFRNLSSDVDQDYFADAITEDIVIALSRWRWFFVIARDSSFAYKDQPIEAKRVGQELGVRYVLEGSVRRSKSRVRMAAKLIDADNSAYVWADKFDRELSDIFVLQDELTQSIAAAIEPKMLQNEGARAVRKSLPDLNAIECYQRGMWHLNRMTADSYGHALVLFREAIRRDPGSSTGYVGLARALYGGVNYGWTKQAMEDLQEARNVARTAIEIDARDAYGHFVLSGVLLYLGQHMDALAAAEQAVDLNVNFAFGHFRHGQVLTYSGRESEAIAPIERSLRLDPYGPQQGAMRGMLALAHHLAGNYVDAESEARKAVDCGNGRAVSLLAASLARLRRFAEARDVLVTFSALQNTSPRPAVRFAYLDPAKLQHLMEGIRLAKFGRKTPGTGR